jgi:thiol-disulfide isomerase/thioredoxin
MSDTIITVIIVVVTFGVIVTIYYFAFGYFPGSKFIMEEVPAENDLSDSQARFMFFYASWCPWSRKADKVWRSFKQHLKNTKAKYGGKTVLFEEINVEQDKGKAALYNIKEYPTFKLETKKKVYRLITVPNDVAFDKFLVSTLGEKTLG